MFEWHCGERGDAGERDKCLNGIVVNVAMLEKETNINKKDKK